VLKKHTLFKNIIKLEPATYLIVKDGSIVEKKEYWNLDYSIDESKTEKQFSEELRYLIEDASALQLRSDVPVGAYLSGGIDSSAVSIFAAKHYDGQLKTFTGAFRESEIYDETRYAKIISKHINSEYLETYPGSNEFLDSIEKLVYHMDEPAAGPGLFPQYMVSKLASEHVKVVLGGQGGDEIFGGYARYAVAYLEQCLKGAIFETQEEGKHVVTLSTLIKNLPLLKQYIPMIKSQFKSGMFDSMDKRYFRLINRSKDLHSLYSSEFLAQNSDEALYEKFLQIFNKPDTPSYFNKMTYFDIKTLLPALLQVEDRVSMAVSLESRVPLLDNRIADLTASIPPPIKFADGKTKHIFIEAIRDVIPDAIVNRKDKMGFPVPINEWLQGPLKGYIFDIFNSQAAKSRGLYNVDSLLEQIDKEGKFTRNLWGALNIELWHRQFIDQ
jgi:asparagine synthase (glutamine-hydrolysing)